MEERDAEVVRTVNVADEFDVEVLRCVYALYGTEICCTYYSVFQSEFQLQ